MDAASAFRITGSLLSPAGRRSRLSILIYHRVLAEPDPLFPMEVDAAVFDRQMAALSTHFNVLPLSEAIQRIQQNTLPARAACVTFDDGYADNAEIAAPILKRHGVTATFFIATDYLDGGRMWNDTVIEAVRLASGKALDLTSLGLGRYEISTTEQRRATISAVIKALKYTPRQTRHAHSTRILEITGVNLPNNLMMRAQQVHDLHAAGMGVGAHTASHPILARLDRHEARDEMLRGKERLEDITGAPVRLFAYPNGKPGRDYTADHVELAKELGFEAAVSTAWGVANPTSDLYQLPRFTPWDKTPGKFTLRLMQNLLRRNFETV